MIYPQLPRDERNLGLLGISCHCTPTFGGKVGESSCQFFLSPELEVEVKCLGKFEGQSSKEHV